MSTPYGGNDPQQPQYGQQPGGAYPPSGPQEQPQWGQQQPPQQPPYDPNQPQQPWGQPQQPQQPQQWGQQPGGYTPPQQPQWGQQPPPYGQQPGGGYPQSGPQAQPGYGQQPSGGQYPQSGPQAQPQYGQQPPGPQGQYDYGQQQFPGTTGAPEEEKPAKSKKGLLIGIVALVVVVAVVGILGFVAPGFFKTQVFNNTQMQTDVQKLLSDTYKIDGVTGVTCPAEQKVEDGAKFECTATIAGKPQQIPITVKGDGGNYEVSPPATK
jgi:hypothetical protein